MCSFSSLKQHGNSHNGKRWQWALISTSLCMLSLVACGAAATTPVKGGDFQGAMLVSFAATTTYVQALRQVTDQDFQPGELCGAVYTTATTTYTTLWQPQGQQDTYTKTHQLYVFQSMTNSGASLNQFRHLADVQSIHHVGAYYQGQAIPPGATAKGNYICPTVIGSPPADTPQVWTNDWLTTTVTFTAPLDTYDAALYTISNLGLGLDTVCNPQGSVGQEYSFATTHTLTVQTDTFLTSTTWLQQLRQTPGVANVATPIQHYPC